MERTEFPPLPPKDPRYSRDKDWAYANHAALEREYPNQWVAVVDGRVVAAGKDLGKVRSEAARVTDRFDIAIIFVEHGIHVWFLSRVDLNTYRRTMCNRRGGEPAVSYLDQPGAY